MSQCNLCKEDTRSNKHRIKHFAMNFIAEMHPQWVKADGSCPECENFYKNDLNSLLEISETIRDY